jgi:hypothetical protein
MQILRRFDTVMHPIADGDYALLGLRRFDPRLFSDIAWSTSIVAHRTIQEPFSTSMLYSGHYTWPPRSAMLMSLQTFGACLSNGFR